MTARFARLRKLSPVACLAVAALGLSGCGHTNDPPTSENNGVYVTAGPVTYQLQVSRLLNQYSTEDRQYITGLPLRQAVVTPQQQWYGVFLWAKNQTKRTVATTDNFDIVDTTGNHYRPVAVNPSLNPYAWTSQSLAPGATEPAPDTTASFGPTQGSLLLFKLPTTVYDNRPLTLEIRSPSGKRWATISLDL
ncbi:MAG: hypothetical protein JO244_05005 [Solirubrobacterales bacterium]|nr:hypothetical protein [Solirubrobacterales bacterium]